MARSLMVVDDDADLRETLQEVLSDAGFEVQGARDGAHALELLRTRERLPDLLLLDMMMPVMDGRSFLRAAHADATYAGLKVVIFSASVDVERTAKELGASGYLRKPVSVEGLLDLVERQLVDRA
ncbi:response regulator [Aggregicoccus sp. 17bor-14]|uniref:response regulator n=1 Tax=Myxococcaceae TaxID=31 RepID=UPI00129C5BFD|nr:MULTISPECIES: response regulator [Myxococcaceae]MBF5045237.1 response regulator [Simulacricoccus sp. 17bor-14]MRI90978.1 response regulator [Aggregicoccus sp. 17bor-14]